MSSFFCSSEQLEMRRQAIGHKAVESGDLPTLENVLKKGLNVNGTYRGRTLLHHATKYSDIKIIEFLLANGASIIDPRQFSSEPKQGCSYTYTYAGFTDSLEVFREYKKYGMTLDKCQLKDKKMIVHAVLGKLIPKGEPQGLTWFCIKELMINFFEDDKKLLMELGLSSEFCSNMTDAFMAIQEMGALRTDEKAQYISKMVANVQEGTKPVLIPTGWNHHGFYIGLYGEFGVIINRGYKGKEQTANYQFFRFDPKRFDENIAEKLLSARVQDREISEKVLYKDFLEQINANMNDEFCLEVTDFINQGHFLDQTRGNCKIANAKPFIFFARSIELFNEISSRNLPPIKKAYVLRQEFNALHSTYKLIGCALKDYVADTVRLSEETPPPVPAEKVSKSVSCFDKINEALYTRGFQGLLTGG